MKTKTYSDIICDWLLDVGYTNCFFVAGGNIMHILNSARTRFDCTAVTHEVSAAIATEYFNECSLHRKAFALVTAGPGITNAITGIAGSWLESRELLIIGGQVKVSDLKSHGIRQRGIQEIDGISIAKPITKYSHILNKPINKKSFLDIVNYGSIPRKGPIFFEFPIDVQGIENPRTLFNAKLKVKKDNHSEKNYKNLIALLKNSERPVLLIGSGVNRNSPFLKKINELEIPIMTTWNAADRVDSKNAYYFGRPNTWGQRSANVILQQSDLVVCVGTRLGLQQTGFNWKNFAPNSKIVQIDIDKSELKKGHPYLYLGINQDGNKVIEKLLKNTSKIKSKKHIDWITFCINTKNLLPNNENNSCDTSKYINPYDFFEKISDFISNDEIVIPCSSGGAFTTFMQSFNQKFGQIIVSNKGLASMGYGLAGSLGASISDKRKRTLLFEGDGGFLQNVQELSTISSNNLPVKIFIFSNGGYASIKMTQINYFKGNFIGCDSASGLAMPDWQILAKSFGINSSILDPNDYFSKSDILALNNEAPHIFIVPIDPNQTYYPKISSKIDKNGKITSNPLHMMTPKLSKDIEKKVFKYIDMEENE